MQEFLDNYGYLALMVGTFFEGETAIMVVSSLIHRGLFQFPLTVLAAFFGAFMNDWIYYLIGRLNGIYFLAKRPKMKAKTQLLTGLFNQHKISVLFSYRFLYGFRIVIPLVIGMSGLKPISFLFYSIATGLFWATVVTTVGYFVGIVLKVEPDSFERNFLFIVFGFASFGLLIGFMINLFLKKQIVKSESNEK